MAVNKVKKTKGTVTVDFTGVESGGGSFRVQPGDYAVKIKSGKNAMSAANKPKIAWELIGINGALKDKTFMYDTSLQPQALFKLRNLLLACKVDVPKGVMAIDLTKMKGLVFGVTMDDGEYKGKTRSEVIDTFPVSVKKDGKMIREDIGEDEDFEDEDIEDIEDIDEDTDEDEDEDEDEEELDYNDLSEKELKKLIKEKGIKVKKDATKKAMVKALEKFDAENEEDEDE